MQPLYDINLLHLDESHVVGTWRVVRRYVSQSDQVPPTSYSIGQAERLRFEATRQLLLELTDQDAASSTAADPAGVVLTAAELGQLGSWQILRDELLSRPYLELHLPTGMVRALITRVRWAKDGSDCEMLLYFQTGTELQLRCAPDTPMIFPADSATFT